jgi:periplasmic protein CpxP/Spy
MKILKIFLLLTSLFLFSHASDDKHNKLSHKNLEYLDLNSQQIEKMKEVLIEFKHKYKVFYEYKQEKEDKLKDIIKNNVFDEKSYLEILNDLKIKASLLEIEKMKKIHAILDEKQRKKFSEYLEEWEVE